MIIDQTFKIYILKKEVIQPHLPVRLPCYDFTLVTNSTLGILLQTVRVTTSGITSFHGVRAVLMAGEFEGTNERRNI